MPSDFCVTLEHVRSFAKRSEFPVRPLTLLVGENSSGKTTFMAMLAFLLDSARFPLSTSFNDPPFDLGSFDTIATFKGGKYGRDATFSIGFTRKDREVKATYENEQGTPKLNRLTVIFGDTRLAVVFHNGRVKASIERVGEKEIEVDANVSESQLSGNAPLPYKMMDALYRSIVGDKAKRSDLRRIEEFGSLLRHVDAQLGPVTSSAPIRSKPRRTYDRFIDSYDPEGEHVPTALARALRKGSSSQERNRLEQALNTFGREAGLFEKIAVKSLGKHATDPYQIQIIKYGPPVNLVDVGYGVSQGLPLIAQTALGPAKAAHLIQQPEVHLHPRAQAALGTYFATICADGDRHLVVETHSDYLIDRVRQEVAKRTISPSSVIILFFQKKKLESTVTPIELDENGNITKTPPGYREFFLEEELKLFNLTSIHADDH